LDLLAAERQKAILDLLQTHGAVHVPDLSQRFQVSPSTVRRDLESLDRQGLVRRTYGGAVSIEPSAAHARPDSLSPEFDRIGRAAADLVSPAEAVFIGAGSLCRAAVRHLGSRSGLTAITNSLETACELYRETDLALVITGGPVDRPLGVMTGQLTERALESLRADKLLIEVAGISPIEGLTIDRLPQAQILQSLLETTAELIVLATPDRLGKVGPAWLAPVGEADVVITSRDASTAIAWDLSELGVQVTLV
jgi:DeoR/GlpR family transcriptional regulator of sugar metabolism